MSHFSLVVIGSEIEKQLTPYREDLKAEFKDETEKYRERYQTEEVEIVRLADGSWKFQHFYWDKVKPADSQLERVLFNSIYPTFESFTEGFAGLTKLSDDLYGYWHNPKAKWDGWTIGGRWKNFFLVKEGYISEVKKHFPEMRNHRRPESAKKKWIDFDGMERAGIEEGEYLYDSLESVTKGLEPPKETWIELLRKMRAVAEPEEALEKARAIWRSSGWIDAVEEEFRLYSKDPVEYFKVYSGGREAFVKEMGVKSRLPFAVLYKGEWYERGNMGGWAMVSDEKPISTWSKEVQGIYDRADDDDFFTIVDCHI